MQIALDAMGGDNAPGEIIKGAVEGAKEHKVDIVLVGLEKVVRKELPSLPSSGVTISVVNAPQTIGMAEAPVEAWRHKKDSSLGVGIQLMRDKKVDAFISAGNTGAISTFSLFILGRMEGVERPAIAAVFTSLTGSMTVLLDIGANSDCQPEHIVQFARLGSRFASGVLGVKSPKVALLNNGSEESKGNRLVRESYQLLRQSELNFAGNIEGNELIAGTADVIVTDGFTGNVALKLAEGLSKAIFTSLKESLLASPLAKASKILWGPPIMEVASKWDYSIAPGAPLLGVNGNVIKAHGRSDASDIVRVIGLAKRMVKEGW